MPPDPRRTEPPDDLLLRLSRTFIDVFAANQPYFGGGGVGCYGISLENVAPSGTAVDLMVTFRSGVRYCCFEPGCHFAFFSERGWNWLRACRDRNGSPRCPCRSSAGSEG